MYDAYPSTSSSPTGAAEMPSCPNTWAVQPCSSFGPSPTGAAPSPGRTSVYRSECECMSMKPGQRTRPLPSTTASPSNGVMAAATSATRPSGPMRTSISRGSAPLPSISRAPRTTVGTREAMRTERVTAAAVPAKRGGGCARSGVRAGPPLPFARRVPPLLLEPALLGRPGRARRPAGGLDAQRRGHPGPEALQRQLAIAGLGAFVGGDDAHRRPEAFEQERPLPRPRCRGLGDVPRELHTGVGGVGVLPARPPAAGEPPDELVEGDPQPRRDDELLRHEIARKSGGR